jgi:aspartate/methionine/tyrosine aminotransferase
MRGKLTRMEMIRKAPIIDLLSQVSIPDDVISFGQGIPFYNPPRIALDGAKEALNLPESFQYTTDNGRLDLRQTISEKILNEQGVNLNPERQIMVTNGANQAFMNVILTITNPGDEIVFFSPTYFNYVMATELAACKPILLNTDESYQPILDIIENNISKKTKAIVTISPNNPTGAVYHPEIIRQINSLCRDHSVYHISDEVYEYFVYENAVHKSPLCFDKSQSNTISLFSISKSFALSGLRVGYIVFPENLYNDMLKAQDTIGICAPSLSQYVALRSIPLGNQYCSQFFDVLLKNRSLVKSILSDLTGVNIIYTKGAYYFFILLDSNHSSYEITKKLIELYGIIVLPGIFFDDKRCSFRLSYGNITGKKFEEGLRRLKKGLSNLM